MIFLVVALAIIGGLVFFNLYRSGLLGQIVGNNDPGFLLQWEVSDHGEVSILENSLTAPDVPKYDDEVVTVLEHSADGGLEALPRLQGRLEYHIK